MNQQDRRPREGAATGIGRSVPRKEDLPLVRGEGRFAADIDFPHQLHMRVVRSPLAFGKIRGIDADEALAMPGLVAVWTHDDVAHVPPIPIRKTKVPGLDRYRQHILADTFVRYVGEPVAVVFATCPYTAEDAAEAVIVDVDAMTPVLDATAAPGRFSPDLGTEPACLRRAYGDVDGAFRQAAAVVSLELEIGRHSAIPLETRGAVARYDAASDVIELHGAAKKPHWNRDRIAEMLGRDRAGVQVFEGNVGGSFGTRGELYPEDVLVCLAAQRLRRPVKWIEDRREHLLTANQSRQQLHRIRAAVDAEGRLLAIDDEFFHDQGAYPRTHGTRVVDLTLSTLTLPYAVPAYRVAGHYRLTNKTPCATYRSPGRYEGTFVRERLMDAIAAELGLDPVTVRRVNLVGPEDMPYARPLEPIDVKVVPDSGDYPLLLDKLLALCDWPALCAAAEARRAAGEAVGLGLALFVEKSGGPVDGVRLTVDESGTATLVTGASAVGQGMETALSQICAEALGVDYARVRVVHGQTNRIDYGNGAHASRVTMMSGNATHIAALKVRDRALDVAAMMLQVDRAQLSVADGIVRAGDGDGAPAVSLAEIARALSPDVHKGRDGDPGLSAEGWFAADSTSYPYGGHVAQVQVDRATGRVTVERYWMAYDVGRAVNPMMVEGQLVGGYAQGLGGALYEEFAYDAQGQPLSTTLADYLLPSSAEVPPPEVLITEDCPSPIGPLGVKGAGEGGTTAVGAAIASAIDAALGRHGVVTRLPVTPARLRCALGRGKIDAEPVSTGSAP